MKTLKDFDFKNKRVLVRCDFNVPLNDKGKIQDDFRIRQTIPTIEYLAKTGAKIILMSHLGEPSGKIDEGLSLAPVQEKLTEFLNLPVKKASDCVGESLEKETLQMKAGEILLLENLRFHKGEEENNDNFAKELSKLGDIYVNDAFSVSHRKHASIAGIVKYLPSCAGLLLEKEIKILSQILENPMRPLIAIIGGAKISTKIKVLREFLNTADYLLVGGKIANTILAVKGLLVGQSSLLQEDAEKSVKEIDLTSIKLHLPVDGIVSNDKNGKTYVRESSLAEVRQDEFLLDVGPESVNIFSKIINEAKTIIWSGPMGFFENPLFEKGTKEIAKAVIKNHAAFKIIGGGDTLFAAEKFGLTNKFDHVSTGGGAMLHFLGKEELPGLKVLENR